MTPKMFVYLAGPLTAKHGYTVEQNVSDAAAFYLQFVRAGIPAFCPHLGATLQAAFDQTYETWMAYDFAMIDVVTHVLMLPRWETSEGATREHAYAHEQKKIVAYDPSEILGLLAPPQDYVPYDERKITNPLVHHGYGSRVDHPPHYGGADNPYEAIKVIEAWSLGFCLGNTVKYICRAGKKHRSGARIDNNIATLEDLRKAAWYLNREIERLSSIKDTFS